MQGKGLALQNAHIKFNASPKAKTTIFVNFMCVCVCDCVWGLRNMANALFSGHTFSRVQNQHVIVLLCFFPIFFFFCFHANYEIQ